VFVVRKKKRQDHQRGNEVWEASEEADRGEPARVAEPVPQLQGAQAARQRRGLLPGAVPRCRGRLPHPPRRRGRQVQPLLPRAGGGVRHQAEGTSRNNSNSSSSIGCCLVSQQQP
jgi:hypothetical protein